MPYTSSLQAAYPNGQTIPVGAAWMLTKVGCKKVIFGKMIVFFMFNDTTLTISQFALNIVI
jgi:hypothetical protein